MQIKKYHIGRERSSKNACCCLNDSTWFVSLVLSLPPQPHKHNCSGFQSNYCRNDGSDPECDEAWPWCFTTEPGVRWDYCEIPKCTASEQTAVTENTTADTHDSTTTESTSTTTESTTREEMTSTTFAPSGKLPYNCKYT